MAMYRIGLAIAVLIAIALPSRLSAEEVTPELFGVPDSTNLQAMSAPMSVSRMAAISANIEVVTLNEAALNADRINITLGGVAHSATRTMVETRRDREASGYVSRWTLEGASASSTVTMRNGLIAATFFSGDGRQYFLMPGYGQTQELIEIDPEAVQRLDQYEENDGVVLPQLSPELAPELVPMSVASGEYEVTLLELYTQSASDYVGGDAAVETVIQNKADCINTALVNSGYLDGRVRLVHVRKWLRNESGDPLLDLAALASDPAVLALRDQYRADLVGEFVGINIGGMAYAPMGTWDKATGFHLMGMLSVLGKFTFEHEWAHNMNARHDPIATPPFAGDPYPFARGFIYYDPYPNVVHADILAYAYPRGAFYSSSIGTFNGLPMGTPEQDNIRIIRIGFPLVSQYYPETGCIPSSTALCLLIDEGVTQGNSRFRITIDWINFVGQSGSGQAVAMTSDGGYFWFFNQNNPEVMVKMVNGASANGHFWIFIAGTTNVEVTVNVTDTITGVTRSWHNPLNRMFVSVGDIEAFPQ